MYESLYGNFNNYGISLVLWGLFSLKTSSTRSSSLARAKRVRPTVEFAGKLLRIGRSHQKGCDRCWPLIGHKKIQSQPDKHSNEFWNWFVKKNSSHPTKAEFIQ